VPRCGALSLLQKPRLGASLPSGTAGSNLEQPSKKKVVRRVAVHPRAFELGSHQQNLARRLSTAELQLGAAMMTRIQITQRSTRVKFTLLRCTSAELLFFCRGHGQRSEHYDQVPPTNNERRRGHRSNACSLKSLFEDIFRTLGQIRGTFDWARYFRRSRNSSAQPVCPEERRRSA
jgi:hypothetical protein